MHTYLRHHLSDKSISWLPTLDIYDNVMDSLPVLSYLVYYKRQHIIALTQKYKLIYLVVKVLYLKLEY